MNPSSSSIQRALKVKYKCEKFRDHWDLYYSFVVSSVFCLPEGKEILKMMLNRCGAVTFILKALTYPNLHAVIDPKQLNLDLH